MKKAFDQTVRDLKREVNKKVLKVPGIEQKILDATSNEPWGPHGSYLSEIAHATRNSHEYYLIMSIIWKRINDTGKNWRHVYKGLTVLEYLVAHGSERIIEDISEHTYQISTLADFQYIDSRGRDQGNNVRKKSQVLIALVNDRERIQEVRQKAFSNRDRYGGSFSTDGMHRSASGGSFGDCYGDDRYKDDCNGYSQERDDNRNGRNGDSYSNDGDRYGRDAYRDGDRQGRTRNDGYQFASRSRSAGGDRGRPFDDDDHSSRNGGGRDDDVSSLDDSRDKLPEHSADAPPPPPSYEEAVNAVQIHVDDERDGKTSPVNTDSSTKPISPPRTPPKVLYESTDSIPANGTSSIPNQIKDVDFDEFDPRGSKAPTPALANNEEMDLFGSFSVDDSINSLALVPTIPLESNVPIQSSDSATNFVAVSSTSIFNQADDPFGDSPFKATQQDNLSVNGGGTVQPSTDFSLTESFLEPNAPSTAVPSFQHQSSATPPVMTTAQSTEELLDSILNPYNGVSQSMQHAPVRSQTAPPEFFTPSSNPFAEPSLPAQMFPATQSAQQGVLEHMHPQTQFSQQPAMSSAMSAPNLLSYSLPVPMVSPASSPNLLSYSVTAPTASPASSLPPLPTQSLNKPKFETKSNVWTDTLNRGLIDLNISGGNKSEVDIGVDFDSINRKENLKEKRSMSMAVPMSTVTMGKAMGSGSGFGRSGATGLGRPPPPMMPSHSAGMVGAYGGGYAGSMNQTMGMSPGYGMPQGTAVGYNSLMGIGSGGGGYGSQQPYGGGRGTYG